MQHDNAELAIARGQEKPTILLAAVDPGGETLTLVPSSTASIHGLGLDDLVPRQMCRSVDGNETWFAGATGRYQILFFWRSSCGACMQDALELESVLHELDSNMFEPVGISLDECEDDFSAWVEKTGVDWPQCFVGHTMWDNVFIRRFDIHAPSSFVLLDPAGRIVKRSNGIADLVPELERTMLLLSPY